MKTIQELKQYLQENCYHFDVITIGCHYIHGAIHAALTGVFYGHNQKNQETISG